jgi:hypothetical protein
LPRSLAVETFLDLTRRDELALEPENGEVLTPKIIEIVGSSTAITGAVSDCRRV